MIARRSVLAGLAAAAVAAPVIRVQAQGAAPQGAAPQGAAPQGAAPKRVAIASGTVATEAMLEGNGGDAGWLAFFTELKAQGFTTGTNVVFERYSGSRFNLVRRLQGNSWNALGTTIAGTKPDVVVASNTFIARGAATAADTLPVVFIVGDPRSSGLVGDLTAPGANLTGVAGADGAKREGTRIGFLHEAVSTATKTAYLMKSQAVSPTNVGLALASAATAAGAGNSMTVTPAYFDDVLDDAGLDASAYLRALLEAAKGGAQALAIGEMLDVQTEWAQQLGAMSLALKLPAIAPWRDFVIGGGLMSYGPNQAEMYKTAAQQVARILKGEKPGAIPVAQPVPELVVSKRNAKNLGITLPDALVAKAKEVLM